MPVLKMLYYIGKSRAVKMGWNPRANPAHHGFGPGWVEFFFTNFNMGWFLTRLI